MGASLTLFVGGSRSGKSALAQSWIEANSMDALFLATCIPRDKEMRDRVAAHQARRGKIWRVLETPLNPRDSLLRFFSRNHSFAGGILLDCLSMWVSNALEADWTGDRILKEIAETLGLLATYGAPCAVVSMECGLGFIPANDLARRFGDILGLVNQFAAKFCPNVVFVSCGLPLALKGDLSGVAF